MTTSALKDVNKRLQSLSIGSQLESVTKAVQGAQDQFKALYSSGLGKQIGQTIDGVETLTETITEVLPVVDGQLKDVFIGQALGTIPESLQAFTSTLGSINTTVDDFNQLVSGVSLARITAGSPFAEQIISTRWTPSGDSAQEAIADITAINSSNASENGFNIELITGTSPASIQQALNMAGGVSPRDALGSLQNVLGGNLSDVLGTVVGNTIGDLFGSYLGEVQGFIDNINSNISNINSIIEGVVQDVTGTLNDVLGSISQLSSIPPNVRQQIDQLLGDLQVVEAADLLLPYANPGVERAELEATLSTYSPNVHSTLAPPASSTIQATRVGKDSNVVSFPGDTSNNRFEFIASPDEFEAELRSASREITEVVVHWTAHFLDQTNVGAERINEQHINDRGWSEIGYHYVILKDGRVQRGRSINKVGAHALVNGHNTYSIGIAFVAGYTCNSYDVSSGKAAEEQGLTGPNSINDAQWNSLYSMLKRFYSVIPGGQVWGHDETDDGKIDVGIPMSSYVRSNFGKINVSNPLQPPLSRQQLIAARGGIQQTFS